MAKKHVVFRFLNGLVALTLLLSPLSARAVFAQAPQPPEGALRFAPPEAAADTALPGNEADAPAPDSLNIEMCTEPASPQAPEACSAPATIPFGRDLELMMGPDNTANNYLAVGVNQSQAWSTTSQSTWITGTMTAADCVGTSPGREQVFLYKDMNYGGTCKMLDVGQYPRSGNLGMNDAVTSVKVGANVDLLLCRDNDFTGVCETFTSSDSNIGLSPHVIGNDTATSGKVTLAPHAYGIAVVPVGTDQMQVIMKTGSSGTGYLAAQTWMHSSAWGPLVYLNLSTNSAPAAVSRAPEDYTVVAQSGGALKAMHGNAGGLSLVWQDVPGGWDVDNQMTLAITDAVGSPAVVSTNPYQLSLFYRTSGGEIKFSEWNSGYGWRQTPLSLGKPGSSAISVDPVAVTRDENAIAVFVVVDSRVYVKEWSTAKASDWSDTSWTALTSTGSFSAKAVPPAVASRHRTHIGVGILSTASEVWYTEWSASATTSGWSTPVKLDGLLNSLSLTATSTDDMFLHGANSAGEFLTKKWSRSGQWASWTTQETGWSYIMPTFGVSPRPRELVVFGRNSSSRLQRRSYMTRGGATTLLASTLYGTLRSQAVATFDARTYWLSVYRSSTDGKWYLAAKSTETWTGYTLQLSNHPNGDTASNKVSIAVADMNRDGDDEIAVATLKTDNSAGQLSVFKLVVDSLGAVTGLTSLATTSFSLSGSTFTDITVAVGNLANTTTLNAVPDEIVVAAIRNGYAQVRLATYRFSGSSLSALASQTLDVASGGTPTDLELTIAQVDSTAVEKIVFAAQGHIATALYQYRLSGASFVQEFYKALSWGGNGAYSSAMASGDVDSDGLEEVVYSASNKLLVYPDMIERSVIASSHRSLAVGDTNMDGLAEIVYTYPDPSSFFYQPGATIYRSSRLGAKQSLIEVIQASQTGVPLLADLDGDSLVGAYKGCAEFKEVQVRSVANAQPQWYTANRNNEGAMFNTDSQSSGDEYAWEGRLGGSVTVGFEQDVSFIVKLATVSASVTWDIMGSVGRGSTSEESQATLSGGSYDGDEVTGVVCYTQAGYTCYAYDVTNPVSGDTSTAMACPTRSLAGQATETCEPLSDWYQLTRSAAGDSWAPVGHRLLVQGEMTNTLDLSLAGNYVIPTAATLRPLPPVDPYLVWWDGWDVRKNVKGSTDPTGGGQTWEIQRASAVGTTEHYGFETNLTQSSGVGVGGFTVERSLTIGFGNEWNSSVTWSTGLGFNGEVYNYPSSCSFCEIYTVAPFVYRAQAVTLGGARYPYLEQDYYLTSFGSSNQAFRAASEAPAEVAASVPPQAPVVTSTTHLDPATWYTGDTVVFNWGQPAGDPGVVTGYKWDLNQMPVFTPTATAKLTTTHTYRNLADGVYYLHVRAEGNGRERSPVTHRPVRVDNQSPQVEFVTDPVAPSGFGGWYNAPVVVNVTAADAIGSGVDNIEYSMDGTTWLAYGAPINITANTSGDTVWARATDHVGHTSAPVSTTIELDKTPPTTVDVDGYGLSYANVLTDEVGNAQLVLGGALSDTNAGKLQVEVKAGNTGIWHTVNTVGDLPVPAGNEFSTTMTSLQWIYTPTFDVRGVYPLWARGVDAAGNYETAWIHGAFWWEPDADPELIESMLSVSPHQAYPGDIVTWTVGVRNSGYQEAQLRITNTLPAGLSLVPNSISDEGQYNASARVITWTLDALWPGQMRYLSFQASADNTTTPATLASQLNLMAYWPWEPLPGVPPEPARHTYSTTATLKVLPSAGTAGDAAPRVLNAAVVEGAVVSDTQVTLLVNASLDTRFLYVKEWLWDTALNGWKLARESGWVAFQTGSGFEVTEDAGGKYGRYTWTLSEGDGVKYLGIWVADVNGQISNLNEGNMIYTNLFSASEQQLAAGQRVQYRVGLHAGDGVTINLKSVSGDADVYAWKPRAGFKPHYYSNSVPQGSLLFDVLTFVAPEDGMYVVEVKAVTDAHYLLATSGALLAETQADAVLTSSTSTHVSLAEKDRPAHPLTLSTPYSWDGVETLPNVPGVPTTHPIYLPLVSKQA